MLDNQNIGVFVYLRIFSHQFYLSETQKVKTFVEFSNVFLKTVYFKWRHFVADSNNTSNVLRLVKTNHLERLYNVDTTSRDFSRGSSSKTGRLAARGDKLRMTTCCLHVCRGHVPYTCICVLYTSPSHSSILVHCYLCFVPAGL